ncbi:predicted glycosyltransferase [Sanguibacter keddieii DSM 10542]|uniref:Predicted glycosyltransferase n=1 Tax=Sanguibacter keddieii (strain ATCC 51767 / DSM 10542 / NCFB 3025 / ST-74) TaxID=446469 RepID=D1BC77_SANKS|nr:glycosyltransferase [Sanguibacter keddieii]ACZ20857.1 predicted glycosyltransferase [Sanguibacter keddieii DSM 10542]
MTTLTPTTPASLPADRTPAGAVTAILVTRGTTPYLDASLRAVLAVDRAPARVVVADASEDSSAQVAPDLADRVVLHRVPGARSFGTAVTAVVDDLSVTSTWLWLFHDDSAPEPQALEHLLRALEHTSNVAVAGAKQVRWGAPDELLEVGYTVSRSGRRMTGVEDGELEQGQHDSRDDVLAVGLTGALVRTAVWVELRGTDPTYGVFGDSLDLGYRARRAGHRVVVVPAAVVHHARASLTGERTRPEGPETTPDGLVVGDPSFGPRLRSQLFFLASTMPLVLLPFFMVLAVVAGPVRALYRIAVKQPAQALDEIWAPLWLVARTGRTVRARTVAARTSTVPRRLLAPLLATTRDVVTAHQDRRLAARARRRALHRTDDLDRAEIRQTGRRRRLTLLGLVLALSVVTLVALGPVVATLTSTGRAVGGALLPARGGWSDLWQAISGGWVRDGLGASAPADPLLTALAPVTALTGGDLQLAVNLVVVAGLVLSGLGAWFAAGVVTRSLTLRAWAVLVWTAAPTLLAAVGQGRLGAILAHAALPWFALALVRALGLQRTDVWGRLRMRSQARADQRFQDRERERAAAREVQAALAQGEPVGGTLVDAAADGAADSDAGADASDPDGTAARASADAAAAPVAGVTVVSDDDYDDDLAADDDGTGTSVDAAPRPASSAPGAPVRGSLAALGAAALLCAVVVAGAPVLMLPLVVALVAVAVAVPRHRAPLLLVPLPALTILGPLVVRAVVTWDNGGWRILLGDPGLATGSDAPVAWQQLLGFPDTVRPWFEAEGAWGEVWRYAPGLLGGLLVVTALVGLLRAGGRGTAARVGWAVAATGLATALVSGATVVASGVDGPVTGWAGAGLSLMTLGLLSAGLLGLDGLGEKAVTHTFGWRQVAVGTLAAVLACVPVGGLAAWTVQARGEDSPVEVQALDRAIVPAVGQQMQTSGRQARVLALQTGPDGTVDYQLLHDDGPQLVDSSVVVDVARLGTRPDDLAVPVAQLSAGLDGDQVDVLAELGVGAVLVPPSEDLARAELVSRVDTVAGLERITENESGTIWRVAPVGSADPALQPGWADLYEPDEGGTLVPVGVLAATPLRVDVQVPAGAPGRVVVLAENDAPGWRATLDGRSLRSVGDEQPTFEIGADGGHLVVAYERASRAPWLVLQGTVLVVFVLLALPVRRRRGGAR